MNLQEFVDSLRSKQLFGKKVNKDRIKRLVNDSREVGAGDAFIAIRGERFDGHQAIAEVVHRGARVIVVEELPTNITDDEVTFVLVDNTVRAQAILANAFYGEPSRQLNLVAVTGTNGKTTTSSMISDLLMILGHKTGLVGTLHYKVDQAYYPAINTTPNSLSLQALFHEMIESGCQDAIIEASSHALVIGRLWYTEIDCAIFTNLTREHLDFHQTMNAYAHAKSLLFAQLGQSFSQGRPKLAIINQDDPYGAMMQQVTSAEVMTYSLVDPTATVFADQISAGINGSTFDLYYQGRIHSVKLPMIGEYNVQNYLAAFLCLVGYYNVEVNDVLAATMKMQSVSGRMQMIDCGQEFTVVVDFAHTPDALRRVLAELNAHPHERLLVVMGHSGDNRDSGARPELGDILFEYADLIVLTADNPRHESVSKIAHEMIGQHNEVPYDIIEDRLQAIAYTIAQARPGDIVLFAGKGGEAVQIIGDEAMPYNEAAAVTQALESLLQRKKEENNA